MWGKEVFCEDHVPRRSPSDRCAPDHNSLIGRAVSWPGSLPSGRNLRSWDLNQSHSEPPEPTSTRTQRSSRFQPATIHPPLHSAPHYSPLQQAIAAVNWAVWKAWVHYQWRDWNPQPIQDYFHSLTTAQDRMIAISSQTITSFQDTASPAIPYSQPAILQARRHQAWRTRLQATSLASKR